MINRKDRKIDRKRRHLRVRKNVFGTTDRPRLAIFRSLNHIYAQIINDTNGQTLASASTLEKELKEKLDSCSNITAAKEVGSLIAKKALEKGISKVVFDRGGNIYHGRVLALADAAREAGLDF